VSFPASSSLLLEELHCINANKHDDTQVEKTHHPRLKQLELSANGLMMLGCLRCPTESFIQVLRIHSMSLEDCIKRNSSGCEEEHATRYKGDTGTRPYGIDSVPKGPMVNARIAVEPVTTKY
jgi:hypothetical protein